MTQQQSAVGTQAGSEAPAADWDLAYAAHLPRVYNYVRSRVHDQGQIEALTERTFEMAWSGRHRYHNDVAAFELCLLATAREIASGAGAVQVRTPARLTGEPPAEFAARLRARLAARDLADHLRARQLRLHAVLACLLLAMVLVLAIPPARRSAARFIEQVQVMQLTTLVSRVFQHDGPLRGALRSALPQANGAEEFPEFRDEAWLLDNGLSEDGSFESGAGHPASPQQRVRAVMRSAPVSDQRSSAAQPQPPTFIVPSGGEARIGASRLLLPLLAESIDTAARTRRPRLTRGLGSEEAFSQFCAGRLDVVATARPIAGQEPAKCAAAAVEFIELPLAYAAVVVLQSYQNVWSEALGPDVLLKILELAREGELAPWSRIDGNWPEQSLQLYLLRDSWGLTELFEEIMGNRSRPQMAPPQMAPPLMVGELGTYLYGPDLIANLHLDRYAIAIVPYGYYSAASDSRSLLDVQAARVVGRSGLLVRPNRESITARRYQPLSRVLFLYVNARSLLDPQVRSFVTDVLEQGPQLANRPIFLPLEVREYELAIMKLQARRTGSAFRPDDPDGLTVAGILNAAARR